MRTIKHTARFSMPVAVVFALTAQMAPARSDAPALRDRDALAGWSAGSTPFDGRGVRRNTFVGIPSHRVAPLGLVVAAPPKLYALITEVIPDQAAVKPGFEFKFTVTLDRRARVDAPFQVTLRTILANDTLGSSLFTRRLTVPAGRDETTISTAALTGFPALLEGKYLITVSQLNNTVQQFATIEVSNEAETLALVDAEVASMPSYTPISRMVLLRADGQPPEELVGLSTSRTAAEPGDKSELKVVPGGAYKIELRTRKVNEQNADKTAVVFQLFDEDTDELVNSWTETTGLSKGGRITDFSRSATVSGVEGDTALPPGTYRLVARRKASKRKVGSVEALLVVKP